VWLSLPWIGYPFVVDGGWVLLAVAAGAALVIAVLSGRRTPPPVVRTPQTTRTSLPVA